LAISGQGFFAVETAAQSATGQTTFTGSTYFTREGDFTQNDNGYLINGSGYYLLGYPVAADGAVGSATSPIQVSAVLNNPVATTSSSYVANLPASAADGFVSTPSTVQVFDALGTTHDMTYTWTKITSGKWDLAVDVADGKGTTGVDYQATIPFSFNTNSNAGTLSSITTGSSYTVVTPAASGDPAEVSFGLDFGGADQTMTLNFGNYDTATGLTQFAGSNVSVTSFSQNGLPQGSFSNLSIDSSGNVTINYSNGSTRTIAQIPIVQFNAQDQLQRVTGNAYQATLTSGAPNYAQAGTNGGGTIAASSLESSNVDIATEFTEMIQAQQVYSANAKTITTVNDMLNTIIQAVQ
jgi:flagellar hook protein FlgE